MDDELRDAFHTSDDEENDPDYEPEASTSATRTWPGLKDILKDTVGGDGNETFSKFQVKEAISTPERNKKSKHKK